MYVQILNEVVNLENVDYVNKKEGQKVKQTADAATEVVFVVNIVFKSGVQVQFPFEEEGQCDILFKKISEKLDIVHILL